MVEQVFEDSPAVKYTCTPVSGPHMAGLTVWLREIGYAPRSIAEFVQAAVHIGCWCDQNRHSLSDLDDASIAQLYLHLPKCSCPGFRAGRFNHRVVTHARRFLKYLRDHGIVAAPAEHCTP